MEMLTTDLDYAFDSAYMNWFDWEEPAGELVKDCYQDSRCLEAQTIAVETLLEQLSGLDLQQQLLDWYALAEELIHQDPRGECSTSELNEAKADMFGWVNDRDEEMRDFWGL